MLRFVHQLGTELFLFEAIIVRGACSGTLHLQQREREYLLDESLVSRSRVIISYGHLWKKPLLQLSATPPLLFPALREEREEHFKNLPVLIKAAASSWTHILVLFMSLYYYWLRTSWDHGVLPSRVTQCKCAARMNIPLCAWVPCTPPLLESGFWRSFPNCILYLFMARIHI